VHAHRQPDLTLWFDLPAEVAQARRAAVRQPDRFERQGGDFFTRVHDAYRRRLDADPRRFARIDALLEPAEVWRQVEESVAGRSGHAG
jgi:dTMP kinase